ncbi:MAG: hypothetical protein KatS3mg002_0667 [Candidatus Woesearchaeota archaeon]|nr:MAG: hypothetical protein KatS3mg002_0667 [Candidatus Woesearchaeota archaeon]
MEKKNLNLLTSTITFVIGSFFVLSNTNGITGNVIGATGPGGTITALTGVLLVIASAGFFILVINHGDIHLERLIRETKNNEDINVLKKISELEDKEKYGQNYQEYKK